MKRIAFCLFAFPLLAAPPARFVEHTVGTGLRGGYQVVIADLNHDGKPDLIALASNIPDLVWYENPTWERHVIATGFTQMINLAVVDSGRGDGIPDIVLAHEFSMVAAKSVGVVSLLRHNGDPRGPWTITEIDRLTTSHRIRTADVDGSGKKIVLNLPLMGAKAVAPDYRDQAPLVFYRPGEWKRQEIPPGNAGVAHGIFVIDWDGDGRDEILTCSFEGIHLFKLAKDGKWTRTEISKGSPEPWPKSGSSDIAVGQLGKQRFLATIDPWHGNQVAIYRQAAGAWARQVIDDSLENGHTILTSDLNADGSDEVIAAGRAGPRSVNLYYATDLSGDKWTKQILDAEMPAAACAVADLNADGRPDIACIASTLKWYENQGPPR